jgi:hypothetical protein
MSSLVDIMDLTNDEFLSKYGNSLFPLLKTKGIPYPDESNLSDSEYRVLVLSLLGY